jgi:hypothetical protein
VAQKRSIESIAGQKRLSSATYAVPWWSRLTSVTPRQELAKRQLRRRALFSEMIQPPETFPKNQLALARFTLPSGIFCAHGGQGARREPGR